MTTPGDEDDVPTEEELLGEARRQVGLTAELEPWNRVIGNLVKLPPELAGAALEATLAALQASQGPVAQAAAALARTALEKARR